MKRFEGRRAGDGSPGVVVTGDGAERPLDPRFDLRRHSPDGFEWGYGGSGPAQLALAVLAEAVGDEAAQELYQRFKFRVVGRLPRDGFTLAADEVRRVIDELQAE